MPAHARPAERIMARRPGNWAKLGPHCAMQMGKVGLGCPGHGCQFMEPPVTDHPGPAPRVVVNFVVGTS